MTTETKIHYSKVEIVDADGVTVTGADRDTALFDFYRAGEMYGAFFVNPDTGLVGDWNYAPAIDWDDYGDDLKELNAYVGSKAAREIATANRLNAAAAAIESWTAPAKEKVLRPERRKAPEQLRTVNLIVKVTSGEKKEIERRAAVAGFTKVSDFVRDSLLGYDDFAGVPD